MLVAGTLILSSCKEEVRTSLTDGNDGCYAGGFTVNSISQGHSSLLSCAIKSGKIKCWGENQYGLLGLGDFDSKGDDPHEMGKCLPEISLPAHKLVSSIHISNSPGICALTTDGKVYCWGYNENGQLGLGHTNSIGDQIDEMGDDLQEVNLGGGTVIQLAAGGRHFCALFNDGTVKCWGAFTYYSYDSSNPLFVGDDASDMGENLATINLGGGTATSISANYAVLADGSLYHMDLPGAESGYLPPVGIVDLGTGKTALAISSSGRSACAILNDNSVKCFGVTDRAGQGVTNSGIYGPSLGEQVSELGDNLPTVDLGTGKTAKSISVGADHSCVILNDDSLKCWGDGDDGVLGLGNSQNRGDDLGEMGDNLPNVQLGTGRTALSVSAGVAHTCVLLDNYQMKCWGSNGEGRLGQGDILYRGLYSEQMGDHLLPIDLW